MKTSKQLKPVVAAFTCDHCGRCKKREYRPSPTQTRPGSTMFQAICATCEAVLGAIQTGVRFEALKPQAKQLHIPSDLSRKMPKAAKAEADAKAHGVAHLGAPAYGATKAPTTSSAKPPKTTDPIVKAWLDGARISELAAKAGVRRSVIRRQLQKAVGGKERFRELRANGAGGQLLLFGGVTPGKREPIAISDAKVPRVKSAKGWRDEPFRIHVGKAFEDVKKFVAPDGTEYLVASASEKADLIREFMDATLPPLRIRRLATSRLAKRTKDERALIAQGVKQHQAKRAAKRAAKLARKGGSTRRKS